MLYDATERWMLPMLQIALAHSLLIQAQEDYRRLDTRWGALMASTISAARALLHAQSMAFNRRQRTRALVMPDGRIATVRDLVLDPYSRDTWPRRSAAILHGICYPPLRDLPLRPCREGGARFWDLDPHFYVAQMDIGPPQARKLGDVTLLVAYLDLVNRLYIVWAGALEDKEEALERLEERTSGLTDWTALDPEYQDLLLSRCR